ncbi:MAG: hypothetical protein HOQ36_19360 [Nocardia sp.]|nr:hypothetical protein [Nocardia sp.]
MITAVSGLAGNLDEIIKAGGEATAAIIDAVDNQDAGDSSDSPSGSAGTPVSTTPGDGAPAGGIPDTGTPAGGSPATGTPAGGTPATGTPIAGDGGAAAPAQEPGGKTESGAPSTPGQPAKTETQSVEGAAGEQDPSRQATGPNSPQSAGGPGSVAAFSSLRGLAVTPAARPEPVEHQVAPELSTPPLPGSADESPDRS